MNPAIDPWPYDHAWLVIGNYRVLPLAMKAAFGIFNYYAGRCNSHARALNYFHYTKPLSEQNALHQVLDA